MANATAKDIQDLAKSIQALVSTFGTSSTKSTSKYDKPNLEIVTNTPNFKNILDIKKNEYINIILSDDNLQNIQTNFTNKNSMTIPLNLKNDIMEKTKDYTITKSGFLRNKMFPKFLSSMIYNKLDKLRVFIKIEKINDTSYNIILDQKK